MELLRPEAQAPVYATDGSAGMDLFACPTDGREMEIRPGAFVAVPTGIAVAVPPWYEMQIRPRSGLALRHGVTVLNAPGTVDSDYRGEVKVLLINHGPLRYTIRRGDRIAQAVVAPVARCLVDCVANLPVAPSRSGGFGSTGR